MGRIANMVAALFYVPSLALGASSINISKCGAGQGETQAIGVPNDKGVLVELRSGAPVLIELNTVRNGEATYRWRLLAANQIHSPSGHGRVFEDYERTPLPYGNDLVVRKNGENDLRIFAGPVVMDWSAKDKWSSWLYFCPKLAKVQLVDLTQYQRRP
jgi:hypothetical protein